MIEILDIVATLLLGAVGLYLTHNYSRQIKQKTADSREQAYAELWEVMYPARPTRLEGWDVEELKGPLLEKERKALFIALTSWYYKKGHGMYLGNNTRTMYLKAKHNLVCDIDEFEPIELRKQLQDADEKKRNDLRGAWSIEQLSLLRARMRADLEVYGWLYTDKLSDEEKLFLQACGENWRQKPWNPSSSL